ncbi:hypothetical protein EPO17_01585 [Patescibacteria group bacterium]|nr:MAG: hypothetical protein EPO17_01585 [Patescibacteria group bacterium]
MIFSTESIRETTEADRKLLSEIADILKGVVRTAQETLSEKASSQFTVGCHTVCRALQQVIGKDRITVVDGFYLGLDTKNDAGEIQLFQCEHSWLLTSSGAIIDPHPTGLVGIMPLCPILVVNKGPRRVFGGNHYISDPSVTAKLGNRATWRESSLLARIMLMSKNRKPQGK